MSSIVWRLLSKYKSIPKSFKALPKSFAMFPSVGHQHGVGMFISFEKPHCRSQGYVPSEINRLVWFTTSESFSLELCAVAVS